MNISIKIIIVSITFFTVALFSPFNLLAKYDWNDHFYEQWEEDNKKFARVCEGYPFPEMLISIPYKNFMFHFTEERFSELEGNWINPGCYKESITIRDTEQNGKIVFERVMEAYLDINGIKTEFITLAGIDYAFIFHSYSGARRNYGYEFISLKTFHEGGPLMSSRSPLILFRKLDTIVECAYDPYMEVDDYFSNIYSFNSDGFQKATLNEEDFIKILKKNKYKIKDDFSFCNIDFSKENHGINDFDEYHLEDK